MLDCRPDDELRAGLDRLSGHLFLDDAARAEQDVVGEFLGERTKLEETGFIARKRLHEDYFRWCGESEYRHTRNAFYRIVGDRDGWRPTKRRGVHGFVGHALVGLKAKK